MFATTPQTINDKTWHFPHICCAIPPAIPDLSEGPHLHGVVNFTCHLSTRHGILLSGAAIVLQRLTKTVDSFQQAPLSPGYRCSLWNPIHNVGEQISGKSGRLHVRMANIDKLKNHKLHDPANSISSTFEAGLFFSESGKFVLLPCVFIFKKD